ncbi:hypothetical protein B0H13DRAFT_1870389 [Mycena leptocephala]|nr:hypothetical protein B0H13DRAFT_1870389 [Mycena leptocephala]
MLTFYSAAVFFVSIRLYRNRPKKSDSAPILRGVPAITRGTVDGRPVYRAVPSEVWKYKKRPLPSRQRVEALGVNTENECCTAQKRRRCVGVLQRTGSILVSSSEIRRNPAILLGFAGP